ncbi:Crp/Fnr family transcriptional regulator [Sphingobacterium alkalisoli]|uniref:Crp/Fnr family transcriptional regulator n=1 Tax=Sphingobacterium alkalisoli TaxID=1874115 RepID=A0A4U0H4J3_9SPHI|nr:Crp/Fnr family transcriptional regulator [Sphingobacterium alkalisoli]TJY66623.1 Crp/Fnr family transcriptional regulator [Sphingobacterium alkalisoli]
MHPLFNYINRYASSLMSEKEFEGFRSHFSEKKIKKKQYLLQEGEICKYFAFIVKGAMRKYYIDEKGVEHIVNLYIENWWAGDRESFVMFTPSIYHIDAWEDCEVLLITRESILELCHQFPAFNELLLKLDERNNIATQRRITSSISFTAEKRYADFVDCHPYFLRRFPQHIIASYLGITKDTLSRVRKKALKK